MHPWSTSWGDPIEASSLEVAFAVRFRDYVCHHGQGVATIRTARRKGAGCELLILHITTGRPQRPSYPIRQEEAIGVIFYEDDLPPTILALREDFPDTPHQNMVPENCPCSLCIDDRPWQEAKHTFTASELLHRISIWFERAGSGRLHDLGQPLDPFFGGASFNIVLPSAVFAQPSRDDHELIGYLPAENNPRVLIVSPFNASSRRNAKERGAIVFLTFRVPPAEMSRLRKAPTNLMSLAVSLKARGLDIISDLTDRFDRWNSDEGNREFRFNGRLGLLVLMPIIHPMTGAVEGEQPVAFLTEATLGEIGVALGRLSANISGTSPGTSYVPLLSAASTDEAALSLMAVDLASVHREFDWERAAVLAGRKAADQRKLVLIGAGAIGSLIAETLTREGCFRWTIVDDDVLLPHNLARHTLSQADVGRQKADALAEKLMTIRRDTSVASIPANVLRPGPHAERMGATVAEADLILDASASVAVARHVSDLEGRSRRVSTFFNPAGTAAVLMVEDIERSVDLRSIEAVYYRLILREGVLDNHLSQSADQIPYAGACRAVTNRIPASRATILAGLVATSLKKAVNHPDAMLSISSLSDAGDVTVIKRMPCAPFRRKSGRWTIVIDPELEREILIMRTTKLNNETGGILLGVIDCAAKRIDLVDAWPEPRGSAGGRTKFLRGIDGLQQAVREATAKTLDQIRYVGEWHSHPRRSSNIPSTTDLDQITWLTLTLSVDDCPGVMIIVGDDGLSITTGEKIQENRRST